MCVCITLEQFWHIRRILFHQEEHWRLGGDAVTRLFLFYFWTSVNWAAGRCILALNSPCPDLRAWASKCSKTVLQYFQTNNAGNKKKKKKRAVTRMAAAPGALSHPAPWWRSRAESRQPWACWGSACCCTPRRRDLPFAKQPSDAGAAWLTEHAQ